MFVSQQELAYGALEPQVFAMDGGLNIDGMKLLNKKN